MNTAGPIATSIFIVTALTVIGAVVAYAIFKTRTKSRRRPGSPPGDRVPLSYFVEFEPPEDAGARVGDAAGEGPPPRLNRALLGIALGTGLLTVVLGALVFYLLLREPEPPQPSSPAAADLLAKAISEQGQPRSDSPDAGTGAENGMAGVTEARARAPKPSGSEIVRGPQPDFSRVGSVKPSLFVAKKLDRNRDGRIQPQERVLIHAHVPLFVLVTSEDNGSVEGLDWLYGELQRRGIWARATFFLTANYLSSRKSFLGGPIDQFWQLAFFGSYGALNGTSYDSGAQFWSAERWDLETATVQDEIVTRMRLPRGWQWRGYPWGSRAPFFVVTDLYYRSLKRLRYPALFDSSLVLHPAGKAGRPGAKEARDLPWPFTLDHPLPKEVEYLGFPQGLGRTALRTSNLWEIPAYAWLVRPQGGKPNWQPPVDQSLWAQHACPGEEPNRRVVEDLLSNVEAHYQGNRAPFLLGFRSLNYRRDEACKRATMVQVLDRIDQLIARGYHIRYSSMPDLILWMDLMARQ